MISKYLTKKIQLGLSFLGFDPGPVDGLIGRMTRLALDKARNTYDDLTDDFGDVLFKGLENIIMCQEEDNEEDEKDEKDYYRDVDEKECEEEAKSFGNRFGLTQTEVRSGRSMLGLPGKANIEPLVLPFPLRPSWNLNQKITKLQVHRLLHRSLYDALEETEAYYGYDELVKLGIDITGGCYNLRKVRGGTKFSIHSWGAGYDSHPLENGLWQRFLPHKGRKAALFAKSVYKAFIDIMRKHGWYNMMYELEKIKKGMGRDGMHFQACLYS